MTSNFGSILFRWTVRYGCVRTSFVCVASESFRDKRHRSVEGGRQSWGWVRVFGQARDTSFSSGKPNVSSGCANALPDSGPGWVTHRASPSCHTLDRECFPVVAGLVGSVAAGFGEKTVCAVSMIAKSYHDGS